MEIVLITDPRVIGIPIRECGEPLIDLRDNHELLFGPSPEIENNSCYTKMRRGVFDRLMRANKYLPGGFQICLYEALRTLELQDFLFSERWKRVSELHPTLSNAEIFQEVIRMVAPVKNMDGSKNIPPHSAGAAVDVYLVDSWEKPVDMGILAKDWIKDVDGTLSRTDSKTISAEAIKHRRIMAEAMTEAGFVNMPTEYWHWSYGDQYWAFIKKQPCAIYGPL